MRKKQIFNKLDFSKIEDVNNLKIDFIKKEIIDNILLKNGNIDPSISNYDIVVKKGLINLIKNIKSFDKQPKLTVNICLFVILLLYLK